MPEKATRICDQHQLPAAATCGHCGKPVCRTCMQSFGYFCSATCKATAQQLGAPSPETAAAKAAEDRRYAQAQRTAKVVGVAGLAAILLGIAWGLWTFVFHPVGKIAWKWEPPAGQGALQILVAGPEQLTVRADNRIVQLDTACGKQLSEITIKDLPLPPSGKGATASYDDDDGDWNELGSVAGTRVKAAKGGYLVSNLRAYAFYRSDGSLVVQQSLGEKQLSSLTVSPDGATLGGVIEDPLPPPPKIDRVYFDDRPVPLSPAQQKALEEYDRALAARQQSLFCVDLRTGRELWSKRLDKGVHVQGMITMDKALPVLMSWSAPAEPAPAHDGGQAAPNEGGYRTYTNLCGLARDTGKMAWRIKLDMGGHMEPELTAAGLLLFEAADVLHALSGDGIEKYTVPLGGRQIEGRRDELLFLRDARDTISSLDLGTGKELWSTPFERLNGGGLTCDAKRVYMTGIRGTGTAKKKPENAPSLDDIKDMKQLQQAIQKTGGPEIPFLYALDRRTGKVLYAVEAVYGEVLADGDRLLAVADTAHTSALTAMSGSLGATMLKQINPANGRVAYVQANDIGFARPQLAGTRLVGVIYERRQRASAFSSTAVNRTPPKLLGIAAWRVK